MTCNKHSLISSSFNPLLKPILTWDFSWGILPLAAKILFRQSPPSTQLMDARGDIRNNGQAPIFLFQPVPIPDPSKTGSHEVLVCWLCEVRLSFDSRFTSASPGDTVHLYIS
jgi:hypothetical protein